MPADGSSTAPPEAPVILGRVSSAFGVLGWVRVVSFTDPPDNLLQYSPWLLGDGTRWRPVQCATGRPHGSGFIVQLREIASRDEAQALSGSLIAVPLAYGEAFALIGSGDREEESWIERPAGDPRHRLLIFLEVLAITLTPFTIVLGLSNGERGPHYTIHQLRPRRGKPEEVQP